ncbi:hypothetical protein [Patulibacter sp.]|uniref:hypothetical protein n=1 Tax=Patulibacter sp. TaxID=1912859 RepID=UPI00271F42BB|nr:hypothetical protein [Patulibacter sp.]MDO9410110.1 hypothetical protein [Patulibacter sp.]
MSHDHYDLDDQHCGSCCSDGGPIPVRIVRGDPYAGPDGQVRLAFEAWVLRVLIVLYVVGAIFY